jgi:hypothetical protein
MRAKIRALGTLPADAGTNCRTISQGGTARSKLAASNTTRARVETNHKKEARRRKQFMDQTNCPAHVVFGVYDRDFPGTKVKRMEGRGGNIMPFNKGKECSTKCDHVLALE